MKYKLSEIFDVEKNKRMMDSFYNLVGIGSAIIDLEGDVLIGVGWQKICTDFHRVNDITCKKCIESDTELANELNKGKKFSLYQCKNGMWDAASPLIIEGEHIANAFVGQFLLESPDEEFFRNQAKEVGFNEEEYLKALKDVPIVPKQRVPAIMEFLVSFAETASTMGLNQIRLKESEKELLQHHENLEKMVEERTAELKESRAQIQNILDTSPVGVAFSTKGIIHFANPRFIETFGVEIGSKSPDLYVIPEERDLLIKKLTDEGRVDNYELQFYNKNREIREMMVTYLPLNYEGEDGILGWLVDITERKAAEIEISIAKDNAEYAADIARLGHWEFDLKTLEFTVNDQVLSLLNTSIEEEGGNIISMDEYLEKFTHPDDRDLLRDQIQSAIKSTEESSFQFEYRAITKDGKIQNVFAKYRIKLDNKNKPYKISGIHLDITERKKAEETLRESEERISLATKAANVGLWDINVKTGELYFSELWMSMLGY